MNHIETQRLILRHFTEEDINALFSILSDKDVNTFLPMFPLKDIEEAKDYLQYIKSWIQQKGFYYAICMKTNNVPIGCIHINGDDSHDLGYSIKKEFWHKGICTEACQAVIDMLKQINIPYITATHDVNNPRSGKVMQAIGMKYLSLIHI